MNLAGLLYASVWLWNKTLSIVKEIPEYLPAFLMAKDK